MSITIPIIEPLPAFGNTKIAIELMRTMSEADFKAILSSGGRDGATYRKEMMQAIAKGLGKVDAEFSTKSEAARSSLFTIVATMLGMLLGTTASKRTLVKNLASHMSSRAVSGDPLDVAWKILASEFVTYVAEATPALVPSLKFPSCMPDFSLMGIMVLASKVFSAKEMRDGFLDADGSVKSVLDWIPLFQKQFIGNFHLATDLQMSHKDWERKFWTEVVTSTKNGANKGQFSRGFTEEFYVNTANDKHTLVSPDFRAIGSGTGYTKEEFVNYILRLVEFFRKSQEDTEWQNVWMAAEVSESTATKTPFKTMSAFLATKRLKGLTYGQVGSATLVTVPP